MPTHSPSAPPAPPVKVRRGFIEVDEGQVHYREAGVAVPGRLPLVLLHASPGSARTLEPLLRAFGASRHAIAPDTLGNGDSSVPASDPAEVAYFADAHLRALTALGIERFDLYGTHTGANIACEMAIGQPERVRSLIIDGIAFYSDEERADMLANYVPEVTIDQNGSQLSLIWHFVRDAYLFWPWYRKDADHRRSTGLPGADDLHDKAVEVLKAARTFHIPYRAALAYRKEQRLPLVRVPTFVTCAATDMLFAYLDRIRTLLPHAQTATNRGTGSAEALRETVALFEAFLAQQDERQQRAD